MAIAGALLLVGGAGAGVRVQDIAHLKGTHTNRLFGYGLVVGLEGTGDGGESPNTLRALMQLHRAYHAPVFDVDELKTNNNVAIVAVEVTIPEYGGREGQTLDVTVSALGPAKSLRGGQLLVTPLQEATLAVPDVFALAGGRIEIDEEGGLLRGVIRGGAVLEEDFFYNFVERGAISLVLDESKAGFQWTEMLARSINHALQSYARTADQPHAASGRVVVPREPAVAIGPTTVRVNVPDYYLDRPAQFISTVLTAQITEQPKQRARVVINRATKAIAFSGSVSISPTVLQIPGLGTVAVGQKSGAGVAGVDTENTGGVEFQELLATLSKLQLSPEQMVAAVEQLHKTGTLHAQLIYEE